MVICEPDESHRLIVVVLRSEGVGENGNVDQGGEESDDITGEHGVTGVRDH